MATAFALTTRTQLSGAAAALNSLASATYVNLGTLTFNTGKNAACLIELAVTPGTVSGSKQCVLFAQESLDGTNFGTGPSSGTTTTDEPVLKFIGTLPLPTNSTLQRKVFRYPGVLPYAAKLIVKNDSGAAFASSGNDLYTSEQSVT